MKLYEVIAIGRGYRAAGALTYFSTKELNPGDLVLTPLRNKTVPAVVKKVSDARTAKSEIKISDFKLKPVKTFIKENFISPEMLRAVENWWVDQDFAPDEAALRARLQQMLAAAQ